jgi:GNAT superfamily N-acetyltransferase
MLHYIHPHDTTQLERFCQSSPALSPQLVARQNADAHLLLTDQTENTRARCSLWWGQTPPYQSQRLGLVGHYAVCDAEAANELLAAACAELKARGCTMAVGPMDGNTWQHYRFVTGRGTEPLFFLEPDNPADWPQQFVAQGFAPLSEYYSTITTDLRARDPRIEAVAARFATLDVTIRAAKREEFAEELTRIYAVAACAFRENFLYTPISQADFVAQYEPIKSFIQPELVLMAEHKDYPVGFLFALPDLCQAQRGQAIDTIIVKTVAVLPEYAGLGSLLVARSHERAAALGFQRAIHALMHEANKSRSISRHYSQPLRRYTLLAKEL